MSGASRPGGDGAPRDDREAPDDGLDAGIDDGIAVRTVLLGHLPMFVAGVGGAGRAPALWTALVERGLTPIETLAGADLPRGARVGFMLAPTQLRLADDRDDTLMRVPRAGLDGDWLAAAGRLRGTMALFARDGSIAPDLGPEALAAEVDRRARQGAVIGAIVGFAEERVGLPLIF